MVKISPSILSADFAKLGEEVKNLSEAGADFIHVDVTDGHFTPNITIGSQVVKSIKKYSSVPLDVHLMINNVEKHIDSFIDAGADIITFHYEAVKSSVELIRYIKSRGVRVGISIVPSTPVSEIEDLIAEVDLVLVMTVNPGYSGQKFLYSQLDKISDVKKIISAKKCRTELSVDGGIDKKTAKLCIEAGATILVSGSYVFNNSYNNYEKNIAELAN
ncbi:MAG: ribulose-phosphate 3-epimerase [Alphaproteobacteria bacterium]|nr:ribulose-phosphate 3-epimerase [Alphaproteobacteria bacterium]